MQITIALPDNLPLTEADVRIELAIGLDRSLRCDRSLSHCKSDRTSILESSVKYPIYRHQI